MDQIRDLTSYLHERCPKMEHHNLAIIRGARKDPSLLTHSSSISTGLER